MDFEGSTISRRGIILTTYAFGLFALSSPAAELFQTEVWLSEIAKLPEE